MRLLPVFALMLILVMATVARAAELSADAACKVVTSFAATHHPAIETTPPGRYYCREEINPAAPAFFIIDLHCDASEPPGWVGSDLVAWYAVRRNDGKLFDWDIASDALGEPITP